MVRVMATLNLSPDVSVSIDREHENFTLSIGGYFVQLSDGNLIVRSRYANKTLLTIPAEDKDDPPF
jgi:hypothetical protein